MKKKRFFGAVLTAVSLALMTACGGGSAAQRAEAGKAEEKTEGQAKAGAEQAADAGKSGTETAAGGAAAQAGDRALSSGSGAADAAEAGFASSLAGVYSCEAGEDYYTLELFDFYGNLVGQGGIAEKPQGNDPAEPYSFWGMELIPADGAAALAGKGDSFEAGITAFSVMSNQGRYWGPPQTGTVKLTEKGFRLIPSKEGEDFFHEGTGTMEFIRETRGGAAFTDVSPMFGGLEAGQAPEHLEGLWMQENHGGDPVFLEFLPEGSAGSAGSTSAGGSTGSAGSTSAGGGLRIYRKARGREVFYGEGKYFFDKEGKLNAGISCIDNTAPLNDFGVELKMDGADSFVLTPAETDTLFGETLQLCGGLDPVSGQIREAGEKFRRVSANEVPMTVLAAPDDLAALKGELTVKAEGGDRKAVAQFLKTEDVENNGGDFVRVGNLVFFHDYSTAPEDISGLHGNFLYDMDLRMGAHICCYDRRTGKTSVLYEDACYGPLNYVNGMFYATTAFGTDKDDEYDIGIYRFWPDGCGGERFTQGSFAYVDAVSPTGKSLFLHQYRGNSSENFTNQGLFTDGSIYGQALDFSSDESLIFTGYDGEAPILVIYDGKEEKTRVARMDGESGKLKILGYIPESEADSWGYPNIEQMMREGDALYLGAAWYAGTAHILQD